MSLFVLPLYLLKNPSITHKPYLHTRLVLELLRPEIFYFVCSNPSTLIVPKGTRRSYQGTPPSYRCSRTSTPSTVLWTNRPRLSCPPGVPVTLVNHRVEAHGLILKHKTLSDLLSGPITVEISRSLRLIFGMRLTHLNLTKGLENSQTKVETI